MLATASILGEYHSWLLLEKYLHVSFYRDFKPQHHSVASGLGDQQWTYFHFINCRKNPASNVVHSSLPSSFDRVSSDGLFMLLQKLGYPPILLEIIKSFHMNTSSTVTYDSTSSEPFPVSSGVKLGCILAPHPLLHLCLDAATLCIQRLD